LILWDACSLRNAQNLDEFDLYFVGAAFVCGSSAKDFPLRRSVLWLQLELTLLVLDLFSFRFNEKVPIGKANELAWQQAVYGTC
jgi:hypothetical protein